MVRIRVEGGKLCGSFGLWDTARSAGGGGTEVGVIASATMNDAKAVLDKHFLEMRARCVSLAADLDRVERAEAGMALLQSDPRMLRLRKGIELLLESGGNRAERVLMAFSDTTPPPSR